MYDRTTKDGEATALQFALRLLAHGARFSTELTLENAVGSHACSLEALASV
jgi:hypothetical protein